ncbi:DNA repair protein [Aquimixticola soesokkakensis]|nr:DNA repair protein [Aquimixticola soesokkakensis]
MAPADQVDHPPLATARAPAHPADPRLLPVTQLPQSLPQSLQRLHHGFQTATMAALVILTALATTFTLLAAFGLAPWLSISAGWGTATPSEVGLWLQIGGTMLLLGLCFYMPAAWRVLKLEHSHRRFALSLEDITRAYHAAHAADRAGAFALSGEFEDMRTRLAHLRAHPDLAHLEPEILEAAAQMSHVSRDLAVVYNHDKVARAKAFLAHRQHEADRYLENLDMALKTTGEMKRWMGDIEHNEREAERQLLQLEADLRAILPNLGYDFEDDDAPAQPQEARDTNVVKMAGKPALNDRPL